MHIVGVSMVLHNTLARLNAKMGVGLSPRQCVRHFVNMYFQCLLLFWSSLDTNEMHYINFFAFQTEFFKQITDVYICN